MSSGTLFTGAGMMWLLSATFLALSGRKVFPIIFVVIGFLNFALAYINFRAL